MSGGPGRPEDESFAELHNGFGVEGARGRRRGREPVREPERGRPAGLVRYDPEADADPDPPAAAVRPYTWTRGRTTSAHQLEIESLVSTSGAYRETDLGVPAEHHAVAALCHEPHSVAEVAALLALPLGVAKVVLGDMVGAGLLDQHHTASTDGEAPGIDLMERILSGLHRL